MLIRVFDIFFSLTGLIVGSPLLLALCIFGFFDTGSPFFLQERVGRKRKPFILVKFRTMRLDTESTASHLVDSSKVTRLGRFLRHFKLDELPQLWNVLIGEMSLVGPRPCLLNQKELIDARAVRGVYDARPGITGLSQLRGIDMSTPELLAETDSKMLENLDIKQYLLMIFLTVLGKGSGDRVITK